MFLTSLKFLRLSGASRGHASQVYPPTSSGEASHPLGGLQEGQQQWLIQHASHPTTPGLLVKQVLHVRAHAQVCPSTASAQSQVNPTSSSCQAVHMICTHEKQNFSLLFEVWNGQVFLSVSSLPLLGGFINEFGQQGCCDAQSVCRTKFLSFCFGGLQQRYQFPSGKQASHQERQSNIRYAGPTAKLPATRQ